MTDGLAPSQGIRLADNQRLAWLRLIRSENVGPATFLELLKRFGTASNALDALPDLAARGRGKKIRIATPSDAERELENLTRHGAQIICLGEPDYPPALRAADARPPLITVKGNVSCLSRNTVAFVGSRNSSLAGVKLTKQLANHVSKADYLIASGLARGIDSAAHEAGLQNGTVAVFAGGIDYIYPKENIGLASAIVDQEGALITEMPFGIQPKAQDFPRRNRIVAGMSLGLVVVEAARRSGSLISARLANEMGRLVFAVPGSPLDPRSEGANHLIKQGAQLITNADDIIQALQPLSDQAIQHTYSLEERDVEDDLTEPSESDRDRILSAIGHTPTDIDELIRFTSLEPGKVHMILLELDLAGRLERQAGNRVSLV